MAQSKNEVFIAAAGAGKTTRIVREAAAFCDGPVLITTFTTNNEAEIRKTFHRDIGFIPSHVRIQTWFSFLLSETVRPYQSSVYSGRRIDGITFVEGMSPTGISEMLMQHYLSDDRHIYSDKLSKFACKANEKTNGSVIRRLNELFARVYVDEVQDLAGWDIELLDLLLRSSIGLVLVGDIRQSTYKTNHQSKNSQYGGFDIAKKFDEWQKADLCVITTIHQSRRCNKEICGLADKFFPSAPKTTSLNTELTGHDGIFVVRSVDVAGYAAKFLPQALRYNRKEKCQGMPATNFGDSKGLTFDRILIFPHGPLKEVLKSNQFGNLNEPSKLYVAVTRARFSVAIVYDGPISLQDVVLYQP